MIHDERNCDTETGCPFLLDLFKSTFLISAFTVGGGFVIIPLLKGKYVDEYHWINDKDTLDMVAIAQSMPGVIAVNSAVILGYRMAGSWGRWSLWWLRCCPV